MAEVPDHVVVERRVASVSREDQGLRREREPSLWQHTRDQFGPFVEPLLLNEQPFEPDPAEQRFSQRRDVLTLGKLAQDRANEDAVVPVPEREPIEEGRDTRRADDGELCPDPLHVAPLPLLGELCQDGVQVLPDLLFRRLRRKLGRRRRTRPRGLPPRGGGRPRAEEVVVRGKPHPLPPAEPWLEHVEPRFLEPPVQRHARQVGAQRGHGDVEARLQDAYGERGRFGVRVMALVLDGVGLARRLVVDDVDAGPAAESGRTVGAGLAEAFRYAFLDDRQPDLLFLPTNPADGETVPGRKVGGRALQGEDGEPDHFVQVEIEPALEPSLDRPVQCGEFQGKVSVLHHVPAEPECVVREEAPDRPEVVLFVVEGEQGMVEVPDAGRVRPKRAIAGGRVEHEGALEVSRTDHVVLGQVFCEHVRPQELRAGGHRGRDRFVLQQTRGHLVSGLERRWTRRDPAERADRNGTNGSQPEQPRRQASAPVPPVPDPGAECTHQQEEQHHDGRAPGGPGSQQPLPPHGGQEKVAERKATYQRDRHEHRAAPEELQRVLGKPRDGRQHPHQSSGHQQHLRQARDDVRRGRAERAPRDGVAAREGKQHENHEEQGPAPEHGSPPQGTSHPESVRTRHARAVDTEHDQGRPDHDLRHAEQSVEQHQQPTVRGRERQHEGLRHAEAPQHDKPTQEVTTVRPQLV